MCPWVPLDGSCEKALTGVPSRIRQRMIYLITVANIKKAVDGFQTALE
jgi:hypothetical protein